MILQRADSELQSASGGFSLVEIVLALGIIAFCVIATLGLVSIGMNVIHDGNRQSGAMRLIEHIEGSIRNSARVAGTPNEFHPIGDSDLVADLHWSVGGDLVTFGPGKLSIPGESSYACRIELYPPGYFPAGVTPVPEGRLLSPGRAVIRVAWPDTAIYTPNTGWQNAQGTAETIVYFRPPFTP
jgi:type II secretory pathway pseudopilin PulG